MIDGEPTLNATGGRWDDIGSAGPVQVMGEILDDAVAASGATAGGLWLSSPDPSASEPMEVVVTVGEPVASTSADVWTVPVELGARLVGEFELVVPGAARTREVRVRLRRLAALAAFVVEHAESEDRAERRRRWTEALYDLMDLVAPPIEPRVALTQIARLARGVAGSAGAFMVTTDGETIVADGAAVDAWKPEVLAALARDVEVDRHPVRHPSGMPGWTATVSVLPTHLLRQCVLVLVYPPGLRAPSGEEQLALSSFTHIAALILDRVKGIEYDAERAVLEERNRIAAELHDGVIQHLFGVGLELQTARTVTAGTATEERVTRAIEAVDRAIASLRTTVAAIESDGVEAPREGYPDQGP